MESNFLDPQQPSAGPGRDSGSAGKRGRKQILPDPGDGPVAQFARQLSELKRAAGDPSYERMRSHLGAVASKSALSAAARGQSLPSWETTWEFVRSLAVAGLAQDEEATRRTWRLRWEQASEAPRESRSVDPSGPDLTSGSSVGEPIVGASDDGEPNDGAGTGAAASDPGTAPGSDAIGDSGARRATGPPGESDSAPADDHKITALDAPEPSARRHRTLQAGGFAVLVAIIGTFLVIVVLSGRDSATSAGTPPTSPEVEKPPSRYPLPGDSAYPGSKPDGSDLDVTFPDGAAVRVDQPFTKIWRLRNNGTVVWENRFLQAFGDTTAMCESAERVAIPRTEPGQVVDIALPVTPRHEGVCHVPWKMIDEHGELVFPTELRPIRYQVQVVR